MGVGNELRSCGKTVHALKLLSHVSSPSFFFFFLFYPVLVGLTEIPDFLVLKMANSTLELVIAI